MLKARFRHLAGKLSGPIRAASRVQAEPCQLEPHGADPEVVVVHEEDLVVDKLTLHRAAEHRVRIARYFIAVLAPAPDGVVHNTGRQLEQRGGRPNEILIAHARCNARPAPRWATWPMARREELYDRL